MPNPVLAHVNLDRLRLGLVARRADEKRPVQGRPCFAAGGAALSTRRAPS